MTTVGESIQRVQSLYSRGLASKDVRLTPRHIYSCLCTARSILLQQKANKHQHISHWNYQTINCIPLQLAPLHECKGAPTGVVMLRSVQKIPKMVVGLDGELIGPVSTLDYSTTFDKKDFSNFQYAKGRKYTANKPFYFFRNEYIYIGLSKTIKAVFFPAIYHDPVEAYLYETGCEECLECKCKSVFEIEFPIDGDLLKPLVDIAGEECIKLMKQIQQDTNNDAMENEGIKGAMVH